VVDAIQHLIKHGCPSRSVPENFPPWKTAYHYFWDSSPGPIAERLKDQLRGFVRKSAGRRNQPTAAALGHQTACSKAHVGVGAYDSAQQKQRPESVPACGYTRNDFACGCGPNQLVRTIRRKGSAGSPLLDWCPWLGKIWINRSYCGPDFPGLLQEQRHTVEIDALKRSDNLRGFPVLPKHWIAKQTFAGLVQNRKLSRDYGKRQSSATDLVYATCSADGLIPQQS
jgi:transposase